MDDKIMLSRLLKILPGEFTNLLCLPAILDDNGEEHAVQLHFRISEECLKLLEEYHLNLVLPFGNSLVYRQALEGLVPDTLLTLLELHATGNHNGTSFVN